MGRDRAERVGGGYATMHRTRTRMKSGATAIRAPPGPSRQKAAEGGGEPVGGRHPTPPPARGVPGSTRLTEATARGVRGALATPLALAITQPANRPMDLVSVGLQIGGADDSVALEGTQQRPVMVSMETMSSPLASPAATPGKKALTPHRSSSKAGASPKGSPGSLVESVAVNSLKLQLEAEERARSSLESLLQEERRAHREKAVDLSHMALANMEEQRQKAELSDLLAAERSAAAAKRPREPESKIRRELNQRCRELKDLSLKQLQIRQDFDAEVVAWQFQAKEGAETAALLEDRLDTERRRADQAVRAGNRLRDKLQEANRQLKSQPQALAPVCAAAGRPTNWIQVPIETVAPDQSKGDQSTDDAEQRVVDLEAQLATSLMQIKEWKQEADDAEEDFRLRRSTLQTTTQELKAMGDALAASEESRRALAEQLQAARDETAWLVAEQKQSLTAEVAAGSPTELLCNTPKAAEGGDEPMSMTPNPMFSALRKISPPGDASQVRELLEEERGRREALIQELEAVNDSRADAQAEVVRLQAQVQELQAALVAARDGGTATLQGAEARVVGLDSTLCSLGELAALRVTADDLRHQLSTAAAASTDDKIAPELTESLQQAMVGRAASEALAAELQASLDSEQAARVGIEKALQREKASRASAKSTLKDTLAALKEQQAAVEEQQAAMAMAEDVMRHTEAAHQAVLLEKSALEDEVAAARAEVAEVERLMSVQLEVAATEAQRLQAEVVAARAAHQEAEERLHVVSEALRSDYDTARVELAGMTEAMVAAEEAAGEMTKELSRQLEASSQAARAADDSYAHSQALAGELQQSLEAETAARRAAEDRLADIAARTELLTAAAAEAELTAESSRRVRDSALWEAEARVAALQVDLAAVRAELCDVHTARTVDKEHAKEAEEAAAESERLSKQLADIRVTHAAELATHSLGAAELRLQAEAARAEQSAAEGRLKQLVEEAIAEAERRQEELTCRAEQLEAHRQEREMLLQAMEALKAKHEDDLSAVCSTWVIETAAMSLAAEKLAALAAQLEEAERSAKESIEALKSGHTSQMEDLAAELAALSLVAEELRQQTASAKEQTKHLGEKLEEDRQYLRASAVSHRSEHERRLADLRAAHAAELAALSLETEELRQQLASASAERTTADEHAKCLAKEAAAESERLREQLASAAVQLRAERTEKETLFKAGDALRAELQAEKQGLSAAVSELQALLVDLAAAKDMAAAEAAILRERVHEVELDREQLREEAELISVRVEALSQQLELAKEALQVSEGEVFVAVAEKAKLTTRLERLETEMEAKVQALDNERELTAQSAAELQTQARLRNEAEKELQVALEELEMERWAKDLATEAVEQTQLENAELSQRVETLMEASRESDLDAELDRERPATAEAQTEIVRLVSQAQSWQADIESQHQTIRALSEAVATIETQRQDLLVVAAKALSLTDDLELEHSQQATECSELLQALAGLQEYNIDLQADIQGARKELQEASHMRAVAEALEIEADLPPRELQQAVVDGAKKLRAEAKQWEQLRAEVSAAVSRVGQKVSSHRSQSESPKFGDASVVSEGNVLFQLKEVLGRHSQVLQEISSLHELLAKKTSQNTELAMKFAAAKECLRVVTSQRDSLRSGQEGYQAMRQRLEDAQKARREAAKALEGLLDVHSNDQDLPEALPFAPQLSATSAEELSSWREEVSKLEGDAQGHAADGSSDLVQRLLNSTSVAKRLIHQLEEDVAAHNVVLCQQAKVTESAASSVALCQAEISSLKVLKAEAEVARIEARSDLHRVDEALNEAEQALQKERSYSRSLQCERDSLSLTLESIGHTPVSGESGLLSGGGRASSASHSSGKRQSLSLTSSSEQPHESPCSAKGSAGCQDTTAASPDSTEGSSALSTSNSAPTELPNQVGERTLRDANGRFPQARNAVTTSMSKSPRASVRSHPARLQLPPGGLREVLQAGAEGVFEIPSLHGGTVLCRQFVPRMATPDDIGGINGPDANGMLHIPSLLGGTVLVSAASRAPPDHNRHGFGKSSYCSSHQ